MKHIKPLLRKLNLNIILIIGTLFIVGIINLFYTNGETVSKSENRNLAQRPDFSLDSYFSGDYTDNYESYYNDNIILREDLNILNANLKPLRGLIYSVVNDAPEIEDAENADEDSKEEIINEPIELINDYIITGNSAIEIHKYNEALYTQYANSINDIKNSLGNDINVYSLIAPTVYEFSKNPQVKALGDSELTGINKVKDILGSNVSSVDAYSKLKNHKDEYIYFRSDHHWRAEGAYYAYEAFMESKGETPVPLDKYEKGTIEGYLGTYYGATLSSKVAATPDTINYYIPFTQYTFTKNGEGAAKILDFQAAEEYDKYCLFLGGMKVPGEINTNVKNGKKLLIVKDSYANSFIPFLLPHYETIYIVDPRSSDMNIISFAKNKGVKDVLFLNYVFSITKYKFPQLLDDRS